MNLEPLDNPVWIALNTNHQNLALGNSFAKHYPNDVLWFGGMANSSRDAIDSVLELLRASQKTVAWMSRDRLELPKTLKLIAEREVSQMICPTPFAVPELEMRILTPSDLPAMLELVEQTKPGPFAERSIELGQFWGVFENAVLVAMTGERIRLPGFTEVSSVCTHPDFRGRGFASALIAKVCQGIFARRETPFLHVLTGNSGAKQVYEKLGFTERKTMYVTVLRAQSTEVIS
jgi:predicted GNAT family acetyltransferase